MNLCFRGVQVDLPLSKTSPTTRQIVPIRLYYLTRTIFIEPIYVLLHVPNGKRSYPNIMEKYANKLDTELYINIYKENSNHTQIFKENLINI